MVELCGHGEVVGLEPAHFGLLADIHTSTHSTLAVHKEAEAEGQVGVLTVWQHIYGVVGLDKPLAQSHEVLPQQTPLYEVVQCFEKDGAALVGQACLPVP